MSKEFTKYFLCFHFKLQSKPHVIQNILFLGDLAMFAYVIIHIRDVEGSWIVEEGRRTTAAIANLKLNPYIFLLLEPNLFVN